MFKFIKNCFKKVNVRCNGQELSKIKKVLAFIFRTIVFTCVLCVSTVLLIGITALAFCLFPIALVIEGVRQIVLALCDIHELNKEKKAKENKYSEQLQQLEENYNQNRESINHTMELLENSKSNGQVEFGSDVVIQELVPITLEDIEAYIQYISLFNSVESQILEGRLKVLNEIKGRLDTTLGSKEREKLECEYDNIMFIVQERLSRHTEQINNINAYFDKSQKKRRLFK